MNNILEGRQSPTPISGYIWFERFCTIVSIIRLKQTNERNKEHIVTIIYINIELPPTHSRAAARLARAWPGLGSNVSSFAMNCELSGVWYVSLFLKFLRISPTAG